MKLSALALIPALLLAPAEAGDVPACADKAVTGLVQELFWSEKLMFETVPTPNDGKAWRAFSDFRPLAI